MVTPAEAPATLRGSVGEAAEEKTRLLAERSPEGLFEPHGRILVDHAGERLLVPEAELAGHVGHGDDIVDPTGRAQGELR